MEELTLQEVHDYCLNATQNIINEFGWNNISVGVLSEEEKTALRANLYCSVLDWAWGMRHYSEDTNNGILDIALKVTDLSAPENLHAVIICKYDARRQEFAICMLENLIANETTILTGNVLIIALVYSTTFCGILDLDEIYIEDPTPEAAPRYRMYGFAQVANSYNKMSAEVMEVLDTIRRKVNG